MSLVVNKRDFAGNIWAGETIAPACRVYKGDTLVWPEESGRNAVRLAFENDAYSEGVRNIVFFLKQRFPDRNVATIYFSTSDSWYPWYVNHAGDTPAEKVTMQGSTLFFSDNQKEKIKREWAVGDEVSFFVRIETFNAVVFNFKGVGNALERVVPLKWRYGAGRFTTSLHGVITSLGEAGILKIEAQGVPSGKDLFSYEVPIETSDNGTAWSLDSAAFRKGGSLMDSRVEYEPANEEDYGYKVKITPSVPFEGKVEVRYSNVGIDGFNAKIEKVF